MGRILGAALPSICGGHTDEVGLSALEHGSVGNPAGNAGNVNGGSGRDFEKVGEGGGKGYGARRLRPVPMRGAVGRGWDITR